MSLLEDARKRINAVDKKMARLFEERMQAVEDVIRYKQQHQMQVLDTSREQEVIKRNSDCLLYTSLGSFFNFIFR